MMGQEQPLLIHRGMETMEALLMDHQFGRMA
ncbi:MAG: hypothetical protein UU01_C0012G0018 [Parcubacteria group bacterium GW2011_GWA2_40_37]|nr:MAG: hypothetical protein UU01_C0012G0018 [Parcubacteria group bacterium GW2011_GWA2_40_37]